MVLASSLSIDGISARADSTSSTLSRSCRSTDFSSACFRPSSVSLVLSDFSFSISSRIFALVRPCSAFNLVSSSLMIASLRSSEDILLSISPRTATTSSDFCLSDSERLMYCFSTVMASSLERLRSSISSSNASFFARRLASFSVKDFSRSRTRSSISTSSFICFSERTISLPARSAFFLISSS